MEVCGGLGDAPELGHRPLVRLTWKVGSAVLCARSPPPTPGTRCEVSGWQPPCLTQGVPEPPPLGMEWSNVRFHTHGGGGWAELPRTRRQLARSPRAGGRVGPCRGTRLSLEGPELPGNVI